MFRESLNQIEDTPHIITFNFISASHVNRLHHNSYICIYVKTQLLILLSLWAFVVISYIIFLRISVSLIQITQENLKLQGKVSRSYDISVGCSCTGKDPNSESFWGFAPDPTWRASSPQDPKLFCHQNCQCPLIFEILYPSLMSVL